MTSVIEPHATGSLAVSGMRRRLMTPQFTLDEQTIHVWTVPIDSSEFVAARFFDHLSPEEQQRSERFRFAHLKQAFALTHGALRILLAQYIGERPRHIQFAYGRHGKPSVPNAKSIHFNISHSGRIALFAFTQGLEIGIDVEQLGPISGMDDIARRFFRADEVADMLSLPSEMQRLAFFLCWTRKEAYIKAIGGGLSIPLDSFRVTLIPGQPPSLMHPGEQRCSNSIWTLTDIELAPPYVGAVAYPGIERTLQLNFIAEAAELLDLPRS